MDKIIHIKIASLLLFWFGVIFESTVLIGFSAQYITKGYVEQLTFFGSNYQLLNVANFTWLALAHIMHIVAGYWLARGSRKGAVFAIIVCGWETIGFLIIFQSVLLQPDGLIIRIFFAVILWLIISGRKELANLKSENWRPWKNPRTTSQ